MKKNWNEIACWVGKVGGWEEGCLSNFMNLHCFFRNRKVKNSKVDVVWLATTWTLWLTRNVVDFLEEDWDFNDTVWNIYGSEVVLLRENYLL